MKRLLGMAAASAALSGAALAENDDERREFELLSGQVDGKSVMVFVDHHGTAIAVEIQGDRAMILKGIAAGAALAEVQEAALKDDDAVPHGASVADLRADALPIKTSAEDAGALIDAMDGLTDAQRTELKDALAL